MEKLNYDKFKSNFFKKGLLVFSVEDIILSYGVKRRTAQAFLSYNQKQDKLCRIRQSFYCFSDIIPHSFFIANKIYAPCYVSLETALSYHGVIPENIYPVFSVTTRRSQSFVFKGREYVYRSIKKNLFKGDFLYKIDESKVRIAGREKALADWCYFSYLKTTKEKYRFNLKDLDKDKLFDYLQEMGGKRLKAFWKEKYD